MGPNDRASLERALADLDPGARQRLYKRAAQVRKLRQSREDGSRRRAAERDDETTFVRKRDRAGGGSLHDYALRLLEEERASEQAAEAEPGDGAAPCGTVVWIEAGACSVLLGDAVRHCALSNTLTALQQTDLAVGDRVLLTEREGDAPLVAAVLPRRTALTRPDPGPIPIERVIAANVDVAVIVVSVVAPPLHPRFIDRLLLAVGRGGARPVICVNKVDLLGPDWATAPELAPLEPYRAMGHSVHLCSADTGVGVEALLTELAGATTVLVGHSGVGKSSLLNAMRPELSLVTNAVRAADGKGRHTTTASTLYRLPGGAMVIDTPGVRSFGVAAMGREEAAQLFPDVLRLAAGCHFADCTHTHEPGCAVKRAVEGGRLEAERYAAYRKLR